MASIIAGVTLMVLGFVCLLIGWIMGIDWLLVTSIGATVGSIPVIVIGGVAQRRRQTQ